MLKFKSQNIENQKRILLRKLDRSRRAYNPNNYNEDGTIKNQGNKNTCVVEAGTSCKEIDENCELDIAWMVAYLRNKRLMSDRGTSLSYYMDALRNVGQPRKTKPYDSAANYWSFSDPKQLTQQSFDEASLHKIESSYKTYSLDRVLEELDNGRVGLTGGRWYTGYNNANLNSQAVVVPYSGYFVGNHATAIIDYDQDYNGQKVLKCLNSYSQAYGKDGYFYVKFEDFSKMFEFGVYFSSDMPKDLVGWLSINQGQIIKEKDGPKVYYIDKAKKRHIPDEAMYFMMLIALSKPRFKVDGDGESEMLPLVKEGEPITINDIPEWARETAKQSTMWSVFGDREYIKKIFSKYFPEINS